MNLGTLDIRTKSPAMGRLCGGVSNYNASIILGLAIGLPVSVLAILLPIITLICIRRLRNDYMYSVSNSKAKR